MSKKAGNSIFLREYNRRQLLCLVKQDGSISCAELSKISGLTPKSVYEICAGLMQDDFLFESAVGKSGGGRKPSMLSLKPNAYFSIGIDIDVHIVRAVLMDITGIIISEIEIETDFESYEKYVKIIIESIHKLIRENAIRNSRLLGIGLSVAGLIDAHTKKIVFAPNLGWENKDIISGLKEALDFQIYLENEAMASAVCEKWMGECKEDKNFICINIKSGIGAGIYTSDKPYHGVGGSAGEIGHIPIDENGPLCGCKNRGCLETLASSNAIVHSAKAYFGNEINLDKLIVLAQSGNANALKIFKNAAEYLGLAVLFLVNTFNPSKIIIGKDFSKYAEFELTTIINKVNKMALKPNASSVTIKTSVFGDRSSVLGASILPQDVIF